MCNFSLDGTQAKGYSSYSPLSSFFFLPLFLGGFRTPSIPPSSPLHAPWCLHFITGPPSINLSCFPFFKEWLSSHTVLDGDSVTRGVLAPMVTATVSIHVRALLCFYNLFLYSCCLFIYLLACTCPHMQICASLWVSSWIPAFVSVTLSVTSAQSEEQFMRHTDLMSAVNRDRAAALSEVQM